MSQHVDFLGDQLKEGDKVAYIDHCRTSSSLKVGRVVGVTDCFLKVRVPRPYVSDPDRTEVVKVSPYKAVRCPEHRQ